MLEQLKREVYQANMELNDRGLITYTWERQRHRPCRRPGDHQAERGTV